MIFEWDETKRLANLRKHRIDFRDAAEIFSGPTFTRDDRRNYVEQRHVTLGLLRGNVVTVVHAERRDSIRIISLRKANRGEAQIFFSQIAD